MWETIYAILVSVVSFVLLILLYKTHRNMKSTRDMISKEEQGLAELEMQKRQDH